MGMRGLALASFMTNVTIWIINQILMSRQSEFEEALAVSLFDPQVRENIGSYLMIGVPNMTIILLDWMCFQASSLMAGVIGVKEQAVNIILLNILQLTFQTAYGLQQAACALIGRQIGANNIKQAREYYLIIMVLSILVCTVQMSAFYVFRHSVLSAFTQQISLHDKAEEILALCTSFAIMDFIQGVMCGAIKALGQQKQAMIINFVTYWVLVVPSAYYLAFVFNWGN